MLYTYIPDERDVVALEPGIPEPLSGAPWPTHVATEYRLLLAYYIDLREPEPPPGRRLGLPRLVSGVSLGTIAIVDFRRPCAHFSVPISNETFDAHPFAYHGMVGGSVFRVENSSWIRQLTWPQYRHERPNPGAFCDMRHYIFVFHDSIFEAAADDVEVRTVHGSMSDAVGKMTEMIRA